MATQAHVGQRWPQSERTGLVCAMVPLESKEPLDSSVEGSTALFLKFRSSSFVPGFAGGPVLTLVSGLCVITGSPPCCAVSMLCRYYLEAEHGACYESSFSV